MIIGNGFIAINNPDGKVQCNPAVLRPFKKQEIENIEEEYDDEEEDVTVLQTFYRSPRFKRDIEKKKFKIDPPPSKGNMEETPLILVLGPSITMGLASLVTGMFAVQYALSSGNMRFAIPTLMMSISMLIGTVMFPILNRKYQNKKRAKQEKIRQEKYRKYLEEKENEINEECKRQSRILHENFVTVDECAERIRRKSSNLWERTREQNDFLMVRLGLGDRLLEAEITYPEKKFSLDDDNLQEELYKLVQSPKLLRQVP